MLITLEQMNRLHEVQLEMFQELKRVMEELGICYYMAHGSLLSAVTTHEFIAEDDDIDIAVFRKDYERLLKKGNEILSSKYFIQASQNDDFPLSFAKMRKHGTEFNQPVLGKCKCHKGIYIDIFPIDFVPEKESVVYRIKKRLLNARIEARLQTVRSLKQTCLLVFSKLIYPSYCNAIKKREQFFASYDGGEYVTIFGGKASERKMRSDWFGEGKTFKFCGLAVNCPEDYDAYLSRIYGPTYWDKNPAEARISKDRKVEISASYIDFGEDDIIGCKPT